MAAKSSTKPAQVEVSLPAELRQGDPFALRAGQERDGELYSAANLDGIDLTGTHFMECALEAMSLNGTVLRGSRFAESRLTSSYAPVLLASRSSWREVLIEQPRWGSAELYESALQSVRITGGKIDYLNLRAAQLNNVVLEGVVVGELDLSGSTASRVTIRDCEIGTLDLGNARLAGTDLRSSTVSAITGVDGLRGATIDDDQLLRWAPLLAAHLGIIID